LITISARRTAAMKVEENVNIATMTIFQFSVLSA